VSEERPLRIAGFGGTRNAKSSSVRALAVALDAARDVGAVVELLDLETLDIPFYEWGAKPNADVDRFLAAFRAADGLIWACPLYHGTISGVFKNAIDWLEVLASDAPPYLADKPVGLVGLAGGGQALQALTAMEQIVRALRGWSIPLVVPINRARDAFSIDGEVLDARVHAQLTSLGQEAVRAAQIFRRARPAPTG
jgi:FMN reductase